MRVPKQCAFFHTFSIQRMLLCQASGTSDQMVELRLEFDNLAVNNINPP